MTCKRMVLSSSLVATALLATACEGAADKQRKAEQAQLEASYYADSFSTRSAFRCAIFKRSSGGTGSRSRNARPRSFREYG